MIVDASALIAIILDEPEGDRFNRIISDTLDDLAISPVNFIGAAIRADKIGPEAAQVLDEIVRTAAIEIAPVSREQLLLAREAYRKFGKGNHPAKLNLGDCFAYALAKARGEPLLFKGKDFPMTDIETAL